MSELTNTRRIAVGVFIFVGIVLLAIGVFTIGGQRKSFVKSLPLRAIFDDVQGLQAGSNVWLSGMKVGTIKKVSFYGSSQVEVVMNIEKEAQPHIRKDAKAKVSTDGLVGNKILVIYGGNESSPIVAANDLLGSEHPAGAQDMIATLQANNMNLLEITTNLKTITKKLTTGQGTLGELINDPSLADHVKSSVDHLRAASANSERMISNLQDFSTGLRKPGGLANELVTDTTVFRRLQSTVEQLNQAASAAGEFTNSLRTAGNGLNDPHTPVGMMLHDGEVSDDLERTIKNLRVSSRELSDDLEAIQHNFLLRGFFKKKAKKE